MVRGEGGSAGRHRRGLYRIRQRTAAWKVTPGLRVSLGEDHQSSEKGLTHWGHVAQGKGSQS